MDLGIDGRVALVLGASKGIGRGIARALAREGARVAVSSRSAGDLERLAGELGGEATTFPADTGDLDRMAALPAEVAEQLGPVEILVLNTGGPPRGSALDHGTEDGRPRTARWSSRPACCSRPSCPGCGGAVGAGS